MTGVPLASTVSVGAVSLLVPIVELDFMHLGKSNVFNQNKIFHQIMFSFDFSFLPRQTGAMLMHAKPVHKVIMGAIPWAKPNAKVVPVVHIPIMLVPVVTMVRLVQVLVVPRPVWIVARANIRVQTVVPVLRFVSNIAVGACCWSWSIGADD